MYREEVIFDVEGKHIRCGRKVLISHSDYFKVMLQGKFIESSKDVILLNDVDSKSFNIILTTIYDNNYQIPDEDVLMVLQTASMLQFNHITDVCVNRLTNILSPANCISVWLVAEALDIKSLYLKAKYLALTKFEDIKEQDCFLRLSIRQLYRYLSNTKLCCIDELSVFNVAMNWYRSQDHYHGFTRVQILLYIISSIDFYRISCCEFEVLQSNECIRGEMEIVEILSDILKLKTGGDVPLLSKAKRFLNSKRRNRSSAACIVGYNYKNVSSPAIKDISTEYYYDKYRRKRPCVVLKSSDSNFTQLRNILMYDVKEKGFKDIITIPDENYVKLQGYRMLGYKQFVYMLGGEFQLGRGHWNDKVWVFDTIREEMIERTNLPMKLRHFEACIAGDNLYIVGGTAALRVKNTNVYCYSCINDTWTTISKLVMCSQSKCCDYNGNLLVINLNEKCGYLLQNDDWIVLKFVDNEKIVENYPLQYTVFSYDDHIYIKGSSLIRLKQNDGNLIVMDYKLLESVCCDTMESVICDKNTVFTLYKQTMDAGKSITLELLDLETLTTETILQCIYNEVGIEIGDVSYHFAASSKLFNIFHFSLTENDSYICDYTT